MKYVCIILFYFITLQQASAQIIKMVHHPDPPYNIPEGSLKGIEVDLVKTIMESQGYEVVIRHVPYVRMHKEFEAKQHDGVTTVQEGGLKKKYYFSNPYIQYENVYITLPSFESELENVKAALPYRIVSFRNAHKYMGEEYAYVSKNSKQYIEQSQPLIMVNLLYAKRTDIVMIDRRIFLYFRKQANNVKTSSFPKFHYIFEPTQFQTAWKKEEHREKFNQGLTMIKKSGKYDQIIQKYEKFLQN